MKIKLLIFLIIFVLFCSSCSLEENTFKKTIEQLEQYKFDQISYYDEDMLKILQENCLKSGIILKGQINDIVHFVKTTTKEWAYIYNFSLEDDAYLFIENYAGNWLHSRKFGKVVIFGECEYIRELKI